MATAREIFGRAIQKGLAVLGEPSLLDGQPCGNVNVARNARLYAGALDQANDNYVVNADVVTIEKRFNPRVDMLVRHPTEGTFLLSRLAGDDGVTRRFIAVQIPRYPATADQALQWSLLAPVEADQALDWIVE